MTEKTIRLFRAQPGMSRDEIVAGVARAYDQVAADQLDEMVTMLEQRGGTFEEIAEAIAWFQGELDSTRREVLADVRICTVEATGDHLR